MDITGLIGTGPGGLIMRQDIRAALDQVDDQRRRSDAAGPAPTGLATPPPLPGSGRAGGSSSAARHTSVPPTPSKGWPATAADPGHSTLPSPCERGPRREDGRGRGGNGGVGECRWHARAECGLANRPGRGAARTRQGRAQGDIRCDDALAHRDSGHHLGGCGRDRVAESARELQRPGPGERAESARTAGSFHAGRAARLPATVFAARDRGRHAPIVRFDGVNLGLAVESERGLLVPNCQRGSARRRGAQPAHARGHRSGPFRQGEPSGAVGQHVHARQLPALFGTDGATPIINHPGGGHPGHRTHHRQALGRQR